MKNKEKPILQQNISVSGFFKGVGVVLILFIILIYSAVSNRQEREKEENIKKIEEANLKEETIQHFHLHKDELMIKFKKLIKQKKYLLVKKNMTSFLISKDEDLKKLYLKNMLLLLKTIPNKEYMTNYTLYQELLTYRPNNKRFKKKLQFYKKRLDFKKIIINDTFVGIYFPLVKELKQRLRDPNSFEHIQTGFIDKGNYYLIKMQYRARNGFGGMNISVASMKVYMNGHSTIIF